MRFPEMSEMGVAPVILHILDHFSGIFPYKASILRGTPLMETPINWVS